MLADMKKQMKEQQARSYRDRKQAALDCEIIAREQEALKQLNYQLHIATLQRSKVQKRLEDEPETMETRVHKQVTNLGGPNRLLPCTKIATTMRLIHLVPEQEFSTIKFGGGSKSSPTSEPSTSESKDGLKKLSCNSVADRNGSLPRSLIPLYEAIPECEFLKNSQL